MHLNTKYIMYDSDNAMIAKIQPKILMDDINYYVLMVENKNKIHTDSRKSYVKASPLSVRTHINIMELAGFFKPV